MERQKKEVVAKKVTPVAVVEEKTSETVFESVNLLHEKDIKTVLEDIEAESFVPQSFASTKKDEATKSIAEVLDSLTANPHELLHPNVRQSRNCTPIYADIF